MALSRTWYNTLIDDDGSGLTGSVWDKGDVNSLMNAIDAEIARLELVDSCHVTAITRQTASNPNQWNAVEFDTATWQTTAGMFVPPGNYITAPRAGYYLVEGVVTYPLGDGIRGLCIYVNGAPAPGMGGQQVLRVAQQVTYTVINISAIVSVAAGALIQIAAFQNTGVGIFIGGLHPQTTNSMQVHRLK